MITGIMVDRKNYELIIEWLNEQGLKQHIDWDKYTVPGASKMRFSFANEEHAVWFRLRWA
jgi:hypothetical protein